MELLANEYELNFFLSFFGNEAKIVNRLYCDILHVELTRVFIPVYSLENAFFIGRILENDKLINRGVNFPN